MTREKLVNGHFYNGDTLGKHRSAENMQDMQERAGHLSAGFPLPLLHSPLLLVVQLRLVLGHSVQGPAHKTKDLYLHHNTKVYRYRYLRKTLYDPLPPMEIAFSPIKK